MNCPDCGKEMQDKICSDCPPMITYVDLLHLVCNQMGGNELAEWINNNVDLGYKVQYIGEGVFKKIYE